VPDAGPRIETPRQSRVARAAGSKYNQPVAGPGIQSGPGSHPAQPQEPLVLSLAQPPPLIGMPIGSTYGPEPGATRAYSLSSSYPAALAAAGAAPVAIPPDLPEAALRSIFERLDGLCLIGGGDVDPAHFREQPHQELGQIDAARDRAELTLVRWALADDLPVLGICRGVQLLNVAAGGSLYQDIPSQLPDAARHNFHGTGTARKRPTHRVRLDGDSLLAKGLGATQWMTNSFHHQAVKETGDGFRVIGRSDDGVVEAIERPSRRFAVGVQWHPEDMIGADALACRLFDIFVDATRFTHHGSSM
jgi:putative glutamine amidotransferase